jgi:hypothetical protein
MNRYAILQETDGQNLPLGIAVERENEVRVIAVDEFGLPKRISEPYEVLQRDLTTVQYKPGDAGYFEQVLLELQRIASVGQVKELPSADPQTLMEIVSEEVLKARLAAPRVYVPSPKVSPWSTAVERISGFATGGGAEIDAGSLRVAA